MAEAGWMIDWGLAQRRTSETRMNAQSSRSHAVMTLHLGSATYREGFVGGVLCCSDELWFIEQALNSSPVLQWPTLHG